MVIFDDSTKFEKSAVFGNLTKFDKSTDFGNLTKFKKSAVFDNLTKFGSSEIREIDTFRYKGSKVGSRPKVKIFQLQKSSYESPFGTYITGLDFFDSDLEDLADFFKLVSISEILSSDSFSVVVTFFGCPFLGN